jgi:hypothetical protein
MRSFHSCGSWSVKAPGWLGLLGVAAVGLIASLAGCGVTQGGVARTQRSVRPAAYSVSALRRLVADAPCPPPRAVRAASRAQLGAFDAVAAVSCGEAERTYRGAGEWTVAIRRASASGIPALQRAFERPDRFDPPNTICAAVLIAGAPVLFVDPHGHYLVARYPVEHPCGHPLDGVLRAVHQHAWTVVSTSKVRQQRTAAELGAGCDPQLKNMVAIDLQFGNAPSPGGPVFTYRPHSLLDACIYRVSPADLDLGNFVRGIHFDASQSAQVRAALTGPGDTTRSCPAEKTFAWIVAPGSNDGVFLELGGCWRLQRDQAHVTLGTASDPATLARLLMTGLPRSGLPVAELVAVARGELSGLGDPPVKTAFVVATRKNQAENWLEPRAVPPDPANPRAYVIMVRGNFTCSSACTGLRPIRARSAQAIWIPGVGVANSGLGGTAHTLKTLGTLGKVIRLPLTRHPA